MAMFAGPREGGALHFTVQHRQSCFNDLAKQQLGGVGQIRRQQFAQRPADMLLCREANKVGHELVDAHKPQRRVKHQQAHRGSCIQAGQLRRLPDKQRLGLLALGDVFEIDRHTAIGFVIDPERVEFQHASLAAEFTLKLYWLTSSANGVINQKPVLEFVRQHLPQGFSDHIVQTGFGGEGRVDFDVAKIQRFAFELFDDAKAFIDGFQA